MILSNCKALIKIFKFKFYPNSYSNQILMSRMNAAFQQKFLQISRKNHLLSFFNLY